MKIFHNKNQAKYKFGHEFFNVTKIEHADVPERYEKILNSLDEKHTKVEVTNNISIEALQKVHNNEYVDFIRCTSRYCRKEVVEAVYPSVFNSTNLKKSENPLIQAGGFVSDMFTSINSDTFDYSLNSASIAFEAAKIISNNDEDYAYALCRPSGHHASANMAGGYCYFNNSALAANYLSGFGKVSVLDIDYHHGNGTQEIFYERDDVQTLSIHADPKRKFPYCLGFADEKGKGAGLGFNHNYPLDKGIEFTEYSKYLDFAIREIQSFGSEYLVLAFGADTHVKDPICDFILNAEDYLLIGKRLSNLDIPVLIVQEGGYSVEILGETVSNLLEGLEANARYKR